MPSNRARLRALICTLSGLLLATGLVTGLVALGAPPATAAVPTDLSPSATTVTGIPTLSWTRVPGAAKYDVQVSLSSSFATTLVSTSTVNQHLVPTVQLPSGELHWRVRPAGSGDAGWAGASFVRDPLAPPALVAPADGTALAQPSTPPLLSWEPVEGASGYTLQISTDEAFIDPAKIKSYPTQATSYIVPDLQLPTTYYWRVNAQLAAGIGTEWSTPRRYVVEGLAAPALVSPANGFGRAVTDAVLDWAPVPGAATYEVQVSTDENFLTGVETKADIVGTRYARIRTLDNDQYYWRVRPYDAAGNKLDWSQVATWRFRRAWPAQPRLEHPADGATVGDPFWFQWTPSEQDGDHDDRSLASSYTLQISTTRSFTPASAVRSCTTVNTTLVPSTGGCWPAAAGTYYWRVRGNDDYSGDRPETDLISAEVRSFTYLPERAIQVSPAPGEPVSVPTLRWRPVAGAARYQVSITGTSGGFAHTETTTGTSYTPRAKLPEGTYRWQVRTESQDERLGSGLLLAAQPTFTVTSPPAATATVPVPTSAPTASRFPTLTWEPVVGATRYALLARPLGTIGWSSVATNLPYPAGEGVNAAQLEPGTYEWYVDAYNGNVLLASGAAATGRFTVTPLPPVDPGSHRVAAVGTGLHADPDPAAPDPYRTDDWCDSVEDASPDLSSDCLDLRNTPVLSWAPDPTVGYWLLYLSHDRELTNPIAGFTAPQVLTQPMWTPSTALKDSQAGSAYYYSVVPCSAAGVCSLPQHAEHSFSKRSRQVELVSPTATPGETDPGAYPVVSDDVTLTWRDYRDTETTPPTPGETERPETLAEPGRTEARSYVVETATDQNFQNVLERVEVDQTSFTSYTHTYPEGPVYWRVQAIDGSGNPLAWSPVGRFRKQSPVPDLVTPDGTHPVRGDQPLTWDPLPFAASYKVEVYRDDDRIGNAANRVTNATTKQRVLALTKPLPASTTPYTWRVSRVDARGRQGDWSVFRPFLVEGPAPELDLPVAGATVAPSEALFTWRPVAKATSYRFERRLVGATGPAETVTTRALAWAPTAAIAGGSWEWRVTALDTDAKPLGGAAWRPFVVVDALTEVTRAAVVGSGRVGTELAVQPATFEPAATDVTYQWRRNGRDISKATGATYLVTSQDVGQPITVVATGRRDGWKVGTSTSEPVHGTEGERLLASAPPVVSGAARVGAVLTTTTGTWPHAPKLAYQWFVGSEAVARATGSSYTVRTRDAGLPVRVEVRASTPGYAPGVASSRPVQVAKLASRTVGVLLSRKISRKDRGRVSVTVVVPNWLDPTGPVRITERSSVLGTVVLRDGQQGRVTVRLKKLKPGRHRLVVRYLGGTPTLPSVSKVLVLTVRR
ncbi:Ig-like domain repeat protein [Nocardioides sp. SYSU D00038]|uniref:Ig-like domain repeat protein n=1 Tax=Nocardioides sp. SYSU D00038 TaxID=2812554 RepID=UPI001967416E|nr:Ig-like domain repeat protein [Nocardioides sp. SYSU D00038]